MKLHLNKRWKIAIGILLLAGIGLLILRNSPLAPITKVTTEPVERVSLDRKSVV